MGTHDAKIKLKISKANIKSSLKNVDFEQKILQIINAANGQKFKDINSN